MGVDPSHLIPIEDNFWEIGAGPSGPDTEIFFDRGEAFDPENIGIRLLAEDIEKRPLYRNLEHRFVTI